MQLTIEVPERQGGIRLTPQEWSEDEFFDFCQANGDLRIERTAKGEIIVISPAGGYSSLLEKMEEYKQSGLPLGWLLLPKQKQVRVYTSMAAASTVLEAPDRVSADPVLPSFMLELVKIWEPPF